jgi:DNA-binding transcriptional ArsR family regulator
MSMDSEPQMLDFVKALSDVERLRVIGMLTRGPANASRVAERLGLPFRDAFEHLSFLAYIGVVRVRPAPSKQDDVYELDSHGMEKMARRQFAGSREAYVPAPDLDPNARKVLQAYLNADGSIRQIPSSVDKSAQFRIVLEYLIQAFTPGVNYTEKEVNTILRRFHPDTAGLRRDLIDVGLLQRETDGARYWRSL